MIITESDIRQIVRECINEILSEGLTDITYHFTSLDSCIKILSKDSFYLSLSSNKNDAYDNKRLFYLSTQRSRNKRFGYSGSIFNGSCVRMQLNGNALSTRYKGRPIDYWGPNIGKQSYYKHGNDYLVGQGFSIKKREHPHFEMEDRILSYTPEIKDASKYIIRVDVYIDPQSSMLENEKADAKTIYSLCRRYDIPCNCYVSLNDFNSMTNNTVNREIISSSYSNVQKTGGISSHKENEYSKRKKIEILYQLFNVLTLGEIAKIGSDPKYGGLIASTLQKYGLEKYENDVFNDLRTRNNWEEFSESSDSLSDNDNIIKKLGHEIGDDDSIKIMRFAADVLKHFGVSNFDDLLKKLGYAKKRFI